LWEEKRTEKAKEMFPRVIDRLNVYKQLTNQNPSKRYVFLYNARGADAMTRVTDREKISPFKVTRDVEIPPQGFVGDFSTYIYETSDQNEAYYLSAMLNSSLMNKGVKSFQPDGLYGKRNIGRIPFMFSIPQFDKTREEHMKLVGLSKEGHQRVKTLGLDGGFKTMRGKASKLVKDLVEEIDSIVLDLKIIYLKPTCSELGIQAIQHSLTRKHSLPNEELTEPPAITVKNGVNDMKRYA